MAITAETRQDIMELAVAANGAAPGTTLLSELVAMSTSGKSLLEIADSLASSASFTATYPTFQTATEFATEFLGNLVPEASADAKAEGVTIIEGMLAAGQSRGAIILEAATYLAALDTSNASFGSSAALFNNRVSVATYHTITSEAADPWAIPASVTSSPLSVAVGTAAVDTALNPPAPPPAAAEPKTLSLTSGVNNLAGGAAADTFDGSLNNSSLQTLTTVDTVDGGAGADLLTATLNNGLTIRPTISGVETINLGAVTNNSTINLASTTGATKYQLAGSSADLTLTNVDSASAAIEAVGNSGALSIGYTDAALAGTDDVSVAVDGQTGGVTFTDAGGSNKLETLSISAENTASSFALTTTNVGTSALNISGDADLTLTGLSTAVASIDASAATGDVNVTAGITTAGLTFTGGTGADTVKNASTATAYYDNLSGGAGNDTFTLDADGFTSKDSIAGGDGTDKITFFDGDADTTTDADFTAVTGVEKLQAQTGQALTATLGDKAAAAGIASVVTSTGNDVITAEADYGALNVTLSTGDDKVDNALSSSALTATAAAASIDANDTITGGSGSSDKLVITADSNATGAVLSANVTLIESFEFKKSGDKTAKLTLTDNQAAALKTVTIDGSALTGGVASFTLDASAEATATATLSVTGSAGADTIVLGSSKTSVDGGAGNDGIRYVASGVLGASDTVSGGDGTDSLQFLDPTNNTTDVAFTVVDADLANVTNVERIVAAQTDANDAANVTVTLGANALAAGITTFVSSANSDDSVTMAAAFTQALTVSALGGDDKFVANASGMNVSFTTGAWTADDTVTGGSGTDTITLTNSGAGDFSVTADGDLTKVEKITVTDKNGYDYSITTNDANVASGASLEIDGSALLAISGAAGGASTLTVDGSAEADGTLKLTGGASADTLTGGAKVDTIIGGAGNDQITGGGGFDDLQGGAGNDNFVMATEAAYVVTTAGVTNSDTVVGGDGTDTITFSAAVTLAATDLINFSGIEVIDLAGSGNTLVINDTIMSNNGSAALRVDAGGTTGTGAVLTASALTGSNAITVYGTTSTNVDEKYVTGAGDDVFRFADTANVLEATDTITAGAGTDRIDITFDGLNAGTVGVDKISGVESIVVRAAGWSADNTSDNLAITVTNTSYDQTTLTVDASAIGAAADGTLAANADDLTFDGSAVTDTDEAFNVIGGAGPDTITGGSGADTLSGGTGADQITGGIGLDNVDLGDGNDTYVVGTASHFSNLSAAETVNGGAGTDTLQLVSGTYSAADLGGINDIERISMAGGSITLADSVYTANGENLTILENGNVANTVVAGSLTGSNSVTITVDATTNDTITLGAGNDIIQQVDEGANTPIAASDAINGGAGTDTLLVHVEGSATTSHTLANVTNVETVKLYGGAAANGNAADDVVSIVTAAATVAAGATLNIDVSTYYTSATATAAYAGNATIDGSAETGSTAGKFNVTGGGGADTITTGAGADTVKGGAGADTIDGGVGVDNIEGGTGADKITGGTKADTIYGGTGSDTFVYTAVSHSGGSDVDNIADWNSGDDQLQVTLDYSTIVAPVTVNATRITAKAGLSAAQAALSGERGQFVYDTTNSKLYVNVNNDNLITSLDYSIQLSAAATASATVAATDIDFNVTGGTGADTITTGSGADTVDGGAANDTIVTGAGADSVSDSAGDDTVTGGTGADTINVSTGSDDVIYSTTTDGLASVVTLTNVATAADDFTATAGTTVDSVTNFSTTNDDISITGALKTALFAVGTTDGTTIALADNGALDFNAGSVFIFHTDDDLAGDNFGDVDAIATAYNTTNSGTPANASANDEIIFGLGNNSGNAYGLYYFKDVDGDGDISAGDQIALLTIVGAAALAAADVIYS